MKNFIKENWFKLVISLAILTFAISGACYFVYLPVKKNYDFNKCLSNSATILLQQQIEINNSIAALDKLKEETSVEADNKLAEFLKNNPEPDFKLLPMSTFGGNQIAVTNEDFKKSARMNAENIEWQKNKNGIFDAVNKIDNQIRDLEKRRNDTIESDKKSNDEVCYKKFK